MQNKVIKGLIPMTIEIKPITTENKAVLALKNDPFLNTGLLVPIYDGSAWSYRIDRFAEGDITEDCFPDENYEFENMGQNFYGLAAYVDGEYAGFALFFKEFNSYLYLDNLLVSARFRRMGVGRALVEEGMKLAASLNRPGVWLICQDNNLQACEFYLQCGFELGGVDCRCYDGTKQEGKLNLYFYKKAEQ